jgi:hypothetical protein
MGLLQWHARTLGAWIVPQDGHFQPTGEAKEGASKRARVHSKCSICPPTLVPIITALPQIGQMGMGE